MSETNDDRKIEYWNCNDWRDPERLIYESMDEAIWATLDDIDPGETPENITVTGYARRVIDPESWAHSVAEDFYETLDCDDYCGPDADYQRPSDRVEAAALEFVKAAIEEYFVWTCDPVKEIVVNVTEWLAIHGEPGCADPQQDQEDTQ